jgi:hypothetical protein
MFVYTETVYSKPVPNRPNDALFSPTKELYAQTGNSYRRGRLSTVDLLVITSLDQLLLKLPTLFSFFTK